MSTDQVQQEIIDEFSLFDDWMDRYQYLIDLGKKLPPLDPAEKTEDRLLDGCQSRVWLVSEGDASSLHFRAASDAAIVSGLIALILRIYSGRSAEDILATEPKFIKAIGLSQHLSPTRANGLDAMLRAIRNVATSAQQAG
ncbi:SufE family protein [Wenzhouxiangella marina]|uniref:SufE protein probably involved in Fe-S center assembly n=1 Tax=Wenzhouxiangella marina TaxID=1579979 RepID=A0A0K0XV35_9GAMM|nr:SufE family protein [Wenzhouxiangella marina]AKS41481.1 SufE protein probably involved in Fe-S center assembly [Wenzhouxiangella marina]MBB6086761.1 cysteine desulfuration protein SufE [Wenzhouxiangella marina]